MVDGIEQMERRRELRDLGILTGGIFLVTLGGLVAARVFLL